MDTSVIFELGLKEYMTQGLRKVGATAKEVFGQMDKNVSQAQNKFSVAGRSISDLNVRLSLLTQKRDMVIGTDNIAKANREVQELERHINKLKDAGKDIQIGSGMRHGGGGMMGSMFMGSLAARGVEIGARKIFETGHEALGAGMDAEQQIIALKTFLGGDRAKALYAQLQKDSALTPFTTSQILPGMQQLIASGLTPEKSKKDIWSLMNALSATGNAGNAFSLELGESHLAQMAAVGKVDAYFMKEFQRTLHIPMTKLLADEMFPRSPKKGMKQIAEWTENGELKDHVTYDMFVGALEKAGKAGGMFAGALEAQSQTIKGKASTIKDWWNIGMAKSVLDPSTHDNIIKLEDRLISGLEGMPEMIGKVSPVINTLFDRFNDLVPSLKEFGSGLANVARPVGGLLISDTMKELASNVLKLSGTILNDLRPAFEMTANMAKGLAGVAGPLLGLADRLLKKDIPILHAHMPGGSTVGGAANWLFEHGTTMGGLVAYGKKLTDDERKNAPMTGIRTTLSTMMSGLATMKSVKGLFSPLSAPGHGAGSGALEKELGDSSAAIVGGGPKQTIIKLNNLVGAFTLNNNGTAADGRQQTEEWLTTLFLRLMRSVPG